MTIYAGRALLLKIANESVPPEFLTIGVARAVVFEISNEPVDVSSLGDSSARTYTGEAG